MINSLSKNLINQDIHSFTLWDKFRALILACYWLAKPTDTGRDTVLHSLCNATLSDDPIGLAPGRFCCAVLIRVSKPHLECRAWHDKLNVLVRNKARDKERNLEVTLCSLFG
jgi:hypothetical protein